MFNKVNPMKNFRDGLPTILTIILLISTTSCNQTAVTPEAALTSIPTETPAPTSTPRPTLEPGELERQVDVDGLDREYVLHMPPGVNKDTPAPLVMMFHGLYTVALTQSQTRFGDLSNENGFILVYPKGIGASWNGGECCGLAVQDNVDEAAFVRQILSDLKTIVTVDPKRIYAAGFSSGAILTYRLACEMSDVFAAIAPVSGTLFFEPCQPDQKISVLHIHGLDDTTIPFAGGQSIEGAVPPVPPVEQGIETWAKLNGCSASPETSVEGAIHRTVYTDCQSNSTVELITIDGFDHGWPSPTGAGEKNFPATQTIWDFFAAHPKP
jgi:polyhydroxybutyrate depolymerase